MTKGQEIWNPAIEEIWKPVVGAENVYSVSSLGRIRRDAPAQGAVVGRITIGNGHSKGYLVTPISGKTKFIHRLVAAAFIGPCPDGLQVNHKDGNKKNNYYLNLEYVTPQENTLHGSRVLEKKCGESHILAKLTKESVRQMRDIFRATGEDYKSIGKRFGVSSATSRAAIIGRTWKCVPNPVCEFNIGG